MRENGGQYTHAATWFVIAQAELGLADEAWRSFRMLNPINHALDAAAAELYRVEPYVVAADIYSTGALAGRGGWTWYTGSAGWLYRAAVEAILGIRKQGNRILVKPVIPSEWNGFSATIRLAGRSCRIEVSRQAGVTAPAWRSTARPTGRGASSLPKAPAETQVVVRIGTAQRRQLNLRHAAGRHRAVPQIWAIATVLPHWATFFLICQSVSRSREVTEDTQFVFSIWEPKTKTDCIAARRTIAVSIVQCTKIFP